MPETTKQNLETINYHLKILDDNVSEVKKKVDSMNDRFDKFADIATTDALQSRDIKMFGEKLEQHSKEADKMIDSIRCGFNDTLAELQANFTKTVVELKSGFNKVTEALDKRISNVEERVLTLEQAPLKQGNERWRYITDTVLKGLIGIAIGTLAVMTGLKGGM